MAVSSGGCRWCPGAEAPSCADGQPLCLLGLVHVGDELREVNGITVVHKRPDEISQILVCAACVLVGEGGRSDQSKALPGARADSGSVCVREDAAGKVALRCAHGRGGRQEAGHFRARPPQHSSTPFPEAPFWDISSKGSPVLRNKE